MAKFKRVSADEAMSRRKDHIRERGGQPIMVKGFKSPPSWNKDQRTARFVMTSESVDRYGDIVVQSGIGTTRFMENPQGLLFHCSRSWPVGQWSDVTKILNGRPKRTEGTLNFLPEGIDDDADRAARHVSVGSIRTVSIGFNPDWEQVEFILDEENEYITGLRFNACELIECSVVPVPAQPDALIKDAAGDMRLARDLIEEVLDTYAKTPEGELISLDEYRAKHLDLVGQRSFFIADKSVPAPAKVDATKASTPDDMIGAQVKLNTLLPENAKFRDSDFAKSTGTVIGSWPVSDGEDEGKLALVVEYVSDDVSGIVRGITADRFFAVHLKDDGEEPETPDGDDPDDDDEVTAGEKAKNDPSWDCKASRDLPIDTESSWDGGAAKGRLLDAAGIGGDSPDHAMAAKGFLAVDTANPDLKGSYKLPFADMKDGKMTALKSGIDAAASRLPQADIPESVQKDARAVLDAYEGKMDSSKGFEPERDTEGLSIDTINALVKLGVVFVTEVEVDGKKYGGDVLAASWDGAEVLVARRNPDEKVVGRLVEIIPVKDGEAFERSCGDVKANLKMVDKDGIEIVQAKKQTSTISIDLDLSNLDEAHERVSALSKLIDSVTEKMSRFLGKHQEPERIEPVLEPTPEPPSEEQMTAARENASAVLKRLAEKGLA